MKKANDHCKELKQALIKKLDHNSDCQNNEIEQINCQTKDSTIATAPIGSSLKTEYEEILTTEEAAAYFKIPIGSFRNMVSDGQVPFYKVGRRNRYLLSDLMKAFLCEQRGHFYGN